MNIIKIKKLFVCALLITAMTITFASCSDDKAKKTDTKKADSAADVKDKAADSKATSAAESAVDSAVSSASSAPEAEAPAAPETPAVTTQPPEETKYGDAEVYTNEAGNPAAKTESGVEVELTGENMQKLMDEYAAVQGSGSEEEKALLDQIQVLLEVSQNQDISAAK